MNGAAAEFQAALRLSPNDASTHFYLGAALKAKGDLNGAVAELQSALRLSPNDANTHFYLGAALKAKGDLSGAIAEYEAAIRLDPKRASALNSLAWLYATAGDTALRNPPKALEYALRAVALDSTQDTYHLGTLAEAYYVNGDYANAVLTEKKALAVQSDDETRKTHEENLKKYEAAQNAPSRPALRPDPKDSQEHYKSGYALYLKGDQEGAFAEFQVALRLDPNAVNPYVALGTLFNAKGDTNGAIAEFQAALRLDPRRVDAHIGLGDALDAKGDKKGAIAEFLAALQFSPTDASALNNLAVLYGMTDDTTLRNPAKALEYALRAVAADDAKNANHLDTLAIAYSLNGDFSNAVLTEKKALSLQPDDAHRKEYEERLAEYERAQKQAGR